MVAPSTNELTITVYETDGTSAAGVGVTITPEITDEMLIISGVNVVPLTQTGTTDGNGVVVFELVPTALYPRGGQYTAAVAGVAPITFSMPGTDTTLVQIIGTNIQPSGETPQPTGWVWIGTAPANPGIGSGWVDSSQDTLQLQIWNGSQWVTLAGGGGGLQVVKPDDLAGVVVDSDSGGKLIAVDSSNTARFALSSLVVPAAGTKTPLKPTDATGAAGSATPYSREDHKHPKQDVKWGDVSGKPSFAPANAEQNVQSDWNQATTTDDSFIKNKPTLAPSNAEANVQSDWNETTSTSDAFIKNKPTLGPQIPAAASANRGKWIQRKSDDETLIYVDAPSGGGGFTPSVWTSPLENSSAPGLSHTMTASSDVDGGDIWAGTRHNNNGTIEGTWILKKGLYVFQLAVTVNAGTASGGYRLTPYLHMSRATAPVFLARSPAAYIRGNGTAAVALEMHVVQPGADITLDGISLNQIAQAGPNPTPGGTAYNTTSLRLTVIKLHDLS